MHTTDAFPRGEAPYRKETTGCASRQSVGPLADLYMVPVEAPGSSSTDETVSHARARVP
jgi:hypothetical protein